MKLNGITLEARYKKTISFKRPDKNIEFTLHSFLGDDDFEKIYPEPEAPWITKPGNEKFQDLDDPDFVEKILERSRASLRYTALKTIQDVEWETVDMADPDTWENWMKEMADTGFSSNEIIKLQNYIYEVNGLTDDAVSDAVKNSSAPAE